MPPRAAAARRSHSSRRGCAQVYEKGVALFPFPHVREIWLAYVTKFVQRYGGTKLERARDLFEQVVGQCPPDQAKLFYIQYAALEEQYGLVRRAMAVLDRATQAVAEADRMEMYLLYVKKAEEYYGVTKTRPIYERAIESLPDVQARDMCVRFAEMERRLGEIDRARALYVRARRCRRGRGRAPRKQALMPLFAGTCCPVQRPCHQCRVLEAVV